MQLFYSPTSPYARKCRVVARERGLMADIEETACSPYDNPPELQSKNPIGKVPALILDDGDEDDAEDLVLRFRHTHYSTIEGEKPDEEPE